MKKHSYLIAKTNFRGIEKHFCIKNKDRFSHIYIIGKTGTGKSTLLENLILQDISSSRGLVFLDPHGDSSKKIYAAVQNKSRIIYWDVSENPKGFGYNPIRNVSPKRRPLLASGILEIFKKQWDEAWGVRMEHIFRNCLLTLLDQPQATLADILQLLNNSTYRQQALKNLENEQVKKFWLQEYAKYSYRMRAEAIAPIQNKIGAFLANPVLRQALTEPKQNLSLRRIMDQGQILVINLSKGKLGEDASLLLGGLLMTSFGLAAFSRSDISENERRDFFLYADEFQSFTTLSLINMASELRKYRVGLILAHQYLHQLDEKIRNAVIGNFGTLISFRLGAYDATFLEKEFQGVFTARDLMALPNYHIYLKLMIDGKPSLPFSATTFLPTQE
jgi:type IV secretory pathway TraG/TraD family ATPase VirD4